MRKACLEEIYRLAREDGRIVFLGSDITLREPLTSFQRNLPRQFLMEGVSEAHLIGMAAGLAMSGRIPYLNTIATFLTRRCFDQIAIDACLQRQRLRLVASGGGMVYAPLGCTHLAIEDLAVMRALPNMTVLAPADAAEMRRLMPLTVEWDGPIYLRLAKGGDPVCTPDRPFQIGRGVPVRSGGDVAFVTTGVLLEPALRAAEALEARGVQAEVLHMPTLKPFDVEAVVQACRGRRAVVTAEEHTLVGGLGSAVAEALLEGGVAPRFRRLGIPDVFPRNYGSQKELLELYGLTAADLESAALSLLDLAPLEIPSARRSS